MYITIMDLITDDNDNRPQQYNLIGVTYERTITIQENYYNEIVRYKRDRPLRQWWCTCHNCASKHSIAYAGKTKVSCTFQMKANWFLIVRDSLTRTPWWYLPISLSSRTIGYMSTFSWPRHTTTGNMDTTKIAMPVRRNYTAEQKTSYTIILWTQLYTW